MPEKGWSVLTVRTDIAIQIKDLARMEGITANDVIVALLNGRPNAFKNGMVKCNQCDANVKASNLSNHMERVHPNMTKVTINEKLC